MIDSLFPEEERIVIKSYSASFRFNEKVVNFIYYHWHNCQWILINVVVEFTFGVKEISAICDACFYATYSKCDDIKSMNPS